MTAPHSPTPYQLGLDVVGNCITDGCHTVIFEAHDEAADNIDCNALAKHLVACHEACAGLANPDKLPELIAAITAEALEWANFYPDPSDTEGLNAKFAANSALRPIMDALRALQATPAESGKS